MGRDKATLEVDGLPMAVRVAEVLHEAGASRVIAVGGDARALAAAGLEVVADDEPGEGPLPATITALRHTPGGFTAVLSCDLLAPSASVVASLVERLATAPEPVVGAVPLVDGVHQWTHALWRPAALEALEAAQRAGARSLKRAGERLSLVVLRDLDRRAFVDADHPRDLPGGG
jgi:molybdopterin-guanine dinucleotide biosynthesis protein A